VTALQAFFRVRTLVALGGAAGLAAVGVGVPGTAYAAELAPASKVKLRELRYSTALDVTVTVTGGVLWFSSELLKSSLAPESCRWCSSTSAERSVRNALLWENSKLADGLSYGTGYALAPLAAYGGVALAGAYDSADRFFADALIITEATVLAGDFNQLVKFSVGRERPFVHALPADQKSATTHPNDNNLSFVSGHTTLAFALAASSGTVASLRGYNWAPGIWATGMALAATTGYLRIAADRHYFIDVMTGAVVGSAFGVGVPLLFHGPVGPGAIQVQPLQGGALATYSGAW